MTFINSEKADAEVIGHIILLGLTITGIGLITLVGVPTIYKLEDMSTVKNAEQTYTMLDSSASKVALGETPKQTIDVNLNGGSISVVPNSSSQLSYVLFELQNGSNTISIPVPMGKIIYRLGDRDVAYEGGGVWSKYPTGSVMLSPPEFNYNGITLTFPIVNISGNYSAGGKGTATLRLEKENSTNNTRIIYPTNTYKNPIDQNMTKVTITIKSEYYDAWADYFKTLSLVKVDSYPDEKKVVVSLDPPPLFTNFSNGALASGSIILENNGETDSYNSSQGKYSISKSENGSIRATISIEIKNNAKVKGYALTAGTISGGGTITKDANASSFGGVTVLGTKYPPVKGLSLGSTTSLVQSKINDYKANNDNNASSANGCLRGTGNKTLDGVGTGWSGGNPSQCTIYPGSTGNYYLTTFSLINNKVLIIDTTTGTVNIVVDSSDFKLDNNANITVNGNNPVKLYLNRNILLSNNAKINPTSNDKSSLFQIVSSSSQDINLDNNMYFYGFIWAPLAEITIVNNAEVYGAMVGKTFTLNNNQKMHYDEALKNLDASGLTSGTSISYLYITQNDIVASIG